MKFASRCLAAIIGILGNCQCHGYRPAIPEQTYRHYDLYIDDTIPQEKIQAGADGWSSVAPVSFSLTKITHAEAMRIHREGGMYGAAIVIVNFDKETATPCPDDALACYQYPGQVFMWTEPLLIWPSIPAHELGHAMGLDHCEVGIMNPYVNNQPDEPTERDGWKLYSRLDLPVAGH